MKYSEIFSKKGVGEKKEILKGAKAKKGGGLL